MKYKVGDKVRVKSLEWYNENNIENGFEIDDVSFDPDMCKYCGKTAIITAESKGYYKLSIDSGEWFWYDWMLEDEPTVSEQFKEKRFQAACSAMNGIVSGLMQSEEWHGWTDEYIAERAYSLADELLKQGGLNE